MVSYLWMLVIMSYSRSRRISKTKYSDEERVEMKTTQIMMATIAIIGTLLACHAQSQIGGKPPGTVLVYSSHFGSNSIVPINTQEDDPLYVSYSLDLSSNSLTSDEVVAQVFAVLQVDGDTNNMVVPITDDRNSPAGTIPFVAFVPSGQGAMWKIHVVWTTLTGDPVSDAYYADVVNVRLLSPRHITLTNYALNSAIGEGEYVAPAYKFSWSGQNLPPNQLVELSFEGAGASYTIAVNSASVEKIQHSSWNPPPVSHIWTQLDHTLDANGVRNAPIVSPGTYLVVARVRNQYNVPIAVSNGILFTVPPFGQSVPSAPLAPEQGVHLNNSVSFD